MPAYHPIACHLHDIYESAIVSRQRLNLRWLDNGNASQARQHTVRPLDLETRDGAEWLLAETRHGESLTLRLDWIMQATPTKAD